MAVISVFIGSSRPGRHGDKVAKWIGAALTGRGHTVHLIDPVEYPDLQTMELPFHYGNQSAQLKKVHELLAASNGFILVSPEYNHSYSGVLKNMLDNFMPEYAHKPFGIATYSKGPFGGIRANEHLRPVVSELKGVPTPLPFLMSGSDTAFDEQGRLKEKAYDERLKKFLDDFEYYVEKLRK
jgi:NAD(P)H-dependent FMN reductase